MLVVTFPAHIGHLLSVLVYHEGSLTDGDFFGFTRFRVLVDNPVAKPELEFLSKMHFTTT